MFKNMRIGLRLGLGFGVSIALMLILGVLAINRLASLDAEMNDVVQIEWPKVVMANKMIDNINDTARSLRNAILQDTPEAVKQEIKRTYDNREDVTKVMEELTQAVKSVEGKAKLNTIKEARAAYGQVQTEILQLLEVGKKDEAKKDLFNKLRPLQSKYFQAVGELIKFQGGLLEKAGHGSG